MPENQWWGQWKTPSVLIGVPSTGSWTEPFGMSLLAMIDWMREDGIDFRVESVCGSLLPKLRNMCVEKALAHNYTHLLFVDTDQTFPVTTPNQLLIHRLPVVAANIATKSMPPKRTAVIRPRHGTRHRDARPAMRNTGLEKVWRVGTGVMLIETEVLRRIEPPWFSIEWLPDEQALMGEDWYFLQKVEDIGAPVYVDHDLSAQVSHWGGYHYRLPEYKA